MKNCITDKPIVLVLCMVLIVFSGLPAYGSSMLRTAGKHPGKCPVLDVFVKDGLVHMDVKDAPYECVIAQLLQSGNIGYKIWESHDRRITLKLDGIPIETAVKTISENYAIVYEYLPQTGQYRFAAMVAVPKGDGPSNGIGDKPGLANARPVPSVSDSAKPVKNTAIFGKHIAPDLKTGKTDSRPQYRPGEIIVKFKPGTPIDRINELNDFIGATVQKKIGRHGMYKVRIDDDTRVPAAIAFYRASGLVLSVGRNLLRYPMAGPLPDDPYFSDQWSLAIADARDAWSIETGDSTVVVGVIDTGIDYTHPDLEDNIWNNEAEKNGQAGVDDDGNGYVDDIHGWDFADNDADPMDYDGHGTHVAGIIGAVGNNGVGVSGVCWHVRLMPLKVEADGSGDLEEADILDAMAYAKDKGVRIFNCSYGGGDGTDLESETMADFRSVNGLFVCAAGNDSANTDDPAKANYPSSYDLDNIISVAASTQDDSLASLSNYGATTVDLMAPGYDILSTYPIATTAMITIVGSGAQIESEGLEFAGRTDDTGMQAGLYDCGYGYSDEIPDEVNGNIALIKRGNRNGDDFYFFQKVENAQTKGAIGAVIYNNEEGNFGGTLARSGDWIPAVSISKQDGQLLLGSLPTQITLVNFAADDAQYEHLSGTSMAAPFVTGLVALMVSRKPGIGYQGIVSGILDNVDPIQSVSDKLVSGGRVNLFSTLGEFLVPGDLTGDDRVGLDDLILCVQILSGISISDPVVFYPKYSDVDRNGKIGLPEAEYIFEKIAGIR